MSVNLANDHVRWVISDTGENLHFIDQRTGVDHGEAAPCAFVRRGGTVFPATAASYTDGSLHLEFSGAGAHAVLKPKIEPRHMVLEVASLSGDGIEEFAFCDVKLSLAGKRDEPFAACVLALNLKTDVRELPGPANHLRATCYPQFGFAGAAASVVASPPEEMRAAMQEAVSDAPDLPRSPIGGPWALDAEINRGSYLFNFGDLSEDKVDDWIALAKSLGINQIDFHGGNSFRFGDCLPNPETYPNGFASLKAVIDRLHDAGIAAGLHTYAFFIDKKCPWVTPVPDSRLAQDATFTLADAVAQDADTIPVNEPTENMSAVTGFFVRNSNTLRIDGELITYAGVSKEAPFAFTGCERGALGTHATEHRAGAAVGHLKECFGLFVPDPETTLFGEVAQKAAEAFNRCGFDMTYMDALDGEDVLGGKEWAWHYGSRFVFEFFKRIDRPALFEASTFHHHLWFVRSRIGAWDHPARSHKKFIDIHCAANEQSRRMFLPTHLGWWSIKTWNGHQSDPTYADDIEYLCCKALATDSGFSIMGVNPENVGKPVHKRLGAIMRQYESLRHEGYFPESVKEKLRKPGAEFTLVKKADGGWTFVPARYDKHRVEGLDGWSDAWTTRNTFRRQPARLRIEALLSAEPFDSSNAVPVTDFADPKSFADRESETGIEMELLSARDAEHPEWACGRYTARNSRPAETSRTAETVFSPTEHGVREPARNDATWAKAGKVFDPPLDISQHEALGVWVLGDGKGEVLNFQLTCPEHLVTGIGEHYIIVDFTGWRYFALIEPEGERTDNYPWPYGGNIYGLYREGINYDQIKSLSLWYNNIEPGSAVSCLISPVRALPLVRTTLKNPSVTIGGNTVLFPVEMETGSYLEYASFDDCALYNAEGDFVRKVVPQGNPPVLETGNNTVRFGCGHAPETTPRAYVSIITRGEAIH